MIHTVRGHGLCPPSGVSGCATRSASASRSGTPSIFVASSLALDRRSPTCCSRPRCASTTARSSAPTLVQYADAYQAGGVDGAAARRSSATQATAAPGPLLVRTVGAAPGRVMFLSLPDGVAPTSTCRGSTLPSPDGEQTWSTLDTGADGRRARSGVGPAARRHAVPGRQEHRAPRRSCCERFRRVLLVQLSLADRHRPGRRRGADVVGAAAGARARRHGARDPADRPDRRARARRRTPAMRSTSWARWSTRCSIASTRCSPACAARSTTSRTICARR